MKTYHISKEILIEKIESSQINWKEGKDLTRKLGSKKIKNKSIYINLETGETKTIEAPTKLKSFFNFFTNLRLPTVEEMDKFSFDKEKDLGVHLDTEYEIGLEFVEELVPHSIEYFLGIKHDTEEFLDYTVIYVN